MNTGSLAPVLRDLGGHSATALTVEHEVELEDMLGPSERTAGDDLQSLIEQTGPMPPDAAADCIGQALAVLRQAHERGVVHGRLTPADLVLDFEGVLKIGPGDGGAAGSSADLASAAAGELRQLGSILHWLLCGTSPPRPGSNGHAGNGAATAHSLQAEYEVPQRLTTLYERLLHAGDPQGFASAAEAYAFLCGGGEPPAAAQCAGRDLEPISSATPERSKGIAVNEASAPADAMPFSAPRRGNVWLYGSVAVTAAILATLIGYLLTH